jgi:hypothetical protein
LKTLFKRAHPFGVTNRLRRHVHGKSNVGLLGQSCQAQLQCGAVNKSSQLVIFNLCDEIARWDMTSRRINNPDETFLK